MVVLLEEKVKFCLVLAALSCASCKYLDFGGDDEKAFEARFFWDRIPKMGEEDPENPGFDRDGNKLPSPETLVTYYMPDVSVGMALEVQPQARLTPLMSLEVMEFKVPKLRWFSVQLMAGMDMIGLYCGKRFTSILEITAGPWFGRDLIEDDFAWGLSATIQKF